MSQIHPIDAKEGIPQDTPGWQERLSSLYTWLDGHSGGWLSLLGESITRFRIMRGLETSASLSFYALFSVFPLTLLLASLLGMIFQGQDAYLRAVAFIRTMLPFSGELIDKELRDVFSQRGSLGIVGGLGLLWSASGYFNTLAANINLAWPKVKLRSFVTSRLVALGMIGVMVLMMMASILSTMLIGLLPGVLFFLGDSQTIVSSRPWLIGLRLFSVFFTYITFAAIYRWIPNKDVDWKSILTGSLLTMLAWEFARFLFTFYLSSGLARYQFVYGSLGALIALLVWIYFSNLITLYGAYLVATLDLKNDQDVMAENARNPETKINKTVHG